jgi:hypothetical protein
MLFPSTSYNLTFVFKDSVRNILVVGATFYLSDLRRVCLNTFKFTYLQIYILSSPTFCDCTMLILSSNFCKFVVKMLFCLCPVLLAIEVCDVDSKTRPVHFLKGKAENSVLK